MFGTLFKNGTAASSFTQDDIDNNRITYQEIASNVSIDSFTFDVSDPDGNHIGDTVFIFDITSAAVSVIGTNFSVVVNTSLLASSFFTVSNPSNDSITTYAFWDEGSENGHFAVNGVAQPDSEWIYVDASNLGHIQYVGGSSPGSETLYVSVYDAWTEAWTAAASLTATSTTLLNQAPVATINDHSLHINEWSQVNSWLSYSDADGNAVTMYQFRDDGTAANSGYFWTPSNAHNPPGTPITVAAADIANVWVRGGTAGGSETMSVRAFDGTDWSGWDTFTFTTLPNNLPSALINDHSLHTNEWSQVNNWLSYSDADGNAATQYQFLDEGAAGNSGYFWTPSNPHHPANTPITVSAADLANLWVRGAQSGGNETMSVRAFDGTDWGAWDTFDLITQPNTPPVATITDHTLHINEWSQVKNWLSYSDADGNAATQYQFLDEGAAGNSGYFWTPSNPHHPANTPITVSAADLANVWVRGAQSGQSGSNETMSVRAFDGTDWGAWDSFSLTTALPVAINDHSLHTNEWSQVNNWLSYAGADSNAVTMYQFRDDGTAANSGYFWTPSNAHNPPGTPITVAAADIANVWVRGGPVRRQRNHVGARLRRHRLERLGHVHIYNASKQSPVRAHQRPQPAHQRMVAS